uniref:Glucuronosyltransferase n=1 Tax=Ascaris lumbricoides TaxID=6252 RepID=A0A9J2PPX7_ASCLU
MTFGAKPLFDDIVSSIPTVAKFSNDPLTFINVYARKTSFILTSPYSRTHMTFGAKPLFDNIVSSIPTMAKFSNDPLTFINMMNYHNNELTYMQFLRTNGLLLLAESIPIDNDMLDERDECEPIG